MVLVANLSSGPLNFGTGEIPEVPLEAKGYIRFPEAGRDFEMGGILGMDILSLFNAVLNFRAQEVDFSGIAQSAKDNRPTLAFEAYTAIPLTILPVGRLEVPCSVCQTLFGADVESETHRVGELMTKITQAFPLLLRPFAGFLEKIGVAKLREAAAARAELHGIVQRMIAERRSSRNQGSDLLSLLFAAQDQETGNGMSEQQLEDEVTTIFMAGHETTANAFGVDFLSACAASRI